MSLDGFIQVEADGVGKKLDTDIVSTTAGTSIHRQRAVLVGETGEILQQLLVLSIQQLNVLRAILATLQQAQTGFGITLPNVSSEADFTQDKAANNE